MQTEQPPKTPQEYRLTAQLTSKGLSSDFLGSYLSYGFQFETVTMLKSIPAKAAKRVELFDTLSSSLKNTPTYSERYLNDRELAQAAKYGVTREDLITPETEPGIKRLDEIAVRFREIGAEITIENYESFLPELSKLYDEARSIIK